MNPFIFRGFGCVYLAYSRKMNKEVAIKQYKRERLPKHESDEALLMHECKSPYTVCYYEDFSITTDYFVMMFLSC